MKKATLYKKLEKGVAQCLACAWYCKIIQGRVGVCGTRYNQNGELYSLVYGRPTGLAIDPVEKKPLYHFLPGASVLSFGTVGCNFGCLFCQNFDISQINKEAIRGLKNPTQLKEKLEEVIDKTSIRITPQEIVSLAQEKKVSGIAYTYNEPAIFVEFAHDTAKLAHQKGLKNIYVSNGFESQETFEYIKRYLDAINIDLKSFRREFYQKICQAKLAPVLENIKRFFKSGIEIEITTLIIPGQNESEQELKAIAQFLASVSADLPWHISAFYPTYKMADVSPTPYQTLFKAYKFGLQEGLKYVYIGNVSDGEKSSTYCPSCKVILIAREGYKVTVRNLDQKKGRCQNCQEKIYGIWH